MFNKIILLHASLLNNECDFVMNFRQIPVVSCNGNFYESCEYEVGWWIQNEDGLCICIDIIVNSFNLSHCKQLIKIGK